MTKCPLRKMAKNLTRVSMKYARKLHESKISTKNPIGFSTNEAEQKQTISIFYGCFKQSHKPSEATQDLFTLDTT